MKQMQNTTAKERQPYQTPCMEIVALENVPVLFSVSGSGDYSDLNYGGNGDGSYAD